jgi:hypothetical protein
MTIQVYCDPCTVNSRKVLAGLQQMKVSTFDRGERITIGTDYGNLGRL